MSLIENSSSSSSESDNNDFEASSSFSTIVQTDEENEPENIEETSVKNITTKSDDREQEESDKEEESVEEKQFDKEEQFDKGEQEQIERQQEKDGEREVSEAQKEQQEEGKQLVMTNLSQEISLLQQSETSVQASRSLDDVVDHDESYQCINPISFLNTMHQKMKLKRAPVYNFTHDPMTGHFYCQVEFDGQIYQNQVAKSKKQQAKEAAANIAMKDLSARKPDLTKLIRYELVKAHISANQKTKNIRTEIKQQQIIPPHPLELIPKSVQWYEKQVAQASTGSIKRPCVLLLEFCQMHKLAHPTYNIRDDGRGNYLYDCMIGGRLFTPELAFWQKNDAKDHVSAIAFNILYNEFREKETEVIYKRSGCGIDGLEDDIDDDADDDNIVDS
ncbi:8214_t:CDS:2 [Entrophospora sp. SA101]|nr:8214_t:CDS:2 [Entrophospora sp. SA101]